MDFKRTSRKKQPSNLKSHLEEELSPQVRSSASSLFFSAREMTTEEKDGPSSSPYLQDPEPGEAFLSSRALQERIQKERERVNSKRDRLRSNRSLLDERKSNIIVTPIDHDDDQLAFVSSNSAGRNPHDDHEMEENDDGWIDATNITSISIRNVASPTKVIPISTCHRHVKDTVDGTCWSRFHWMWIIIVVIMVGAVAGVIIGVIVGLGGNIDDNSSSNGSSAGNTTGCEMETNILPGCVCRDELSSALPLEVEFNRNLILTFLKENGVANMTNTTTTSALSTSCTVQNQALVWISDLNNYATTSPTNLQLLQRYALAVMFQTLHGDMWTTSSNTAAEEQQNDEKAIIPWLDPSSSECDWEGIVCSDASQRIVELHLEDHNLDGTLPTTELGLLKSLRDVIMGQNPKVVGSLTTELTALPVLQTLFLSNTALTGTLPTKWSDRITELNLSNMKLTGMLPTELGLLTRLRTLDVANNALSGAIPLVMSTNLMYLEELDLSYNQLVDSLAQQWNSPALETLRVNGNTELTGGFPAPYSTLLSFINFGDTSMEGVVPSGYCDLLFLDSVVVDCEITNSSTVDIQLCKCCQCTNNEES